MLVKATLEDIENYGEFVYQIALDQTKSGYPTYTDGIKTKEEFFATAKKFVKDEDSEVLLYFSEGRMEGWIEYFWIEEDNYLQLHGCNINSGTKQALGELLALLEEKFQRYELYFGFPKVNTEAVEFLQENGFTCIEDDHNTSFFFDSYKLREESKAVVKITKENFEDFRKIHSQEDEDCYWNCERLLADIDSWSIYVYYENHLPVGSIFFNGTDYIEIYGVEFLDKTYRKDVYIAMMAAALNVGKRSGAKYLTYLCEGNEVEAVKELGFVYVGPYVCYIKKVN